MNAIIAIPVTADVLNITCATRGCDRLASLAADDQGDLCGTCRDAEHALGRAPSPSVVEPVSAEYERLACAHALWGNGYTITSVVRAATGAEAPRSLWLVGEGERRVLVIAKTEDEAELLASEDQTAGITTSDPAVAPLPPPLTTAARLLIEGLPDTEVTEARAMAYQALRMMLADEPG